MSPSSQLALAVAVAREAGALLREEFHRPGGPRGGGESADVDVEVERLVRARLLSRCPGYAFMGEETGARSGTGGVWIVDPNDGTRDYLRGMRGSAVSIALVREGRPVLGVVHAPLAPDDDGDLLAWEEGASPVRRAAPYPMVLVSPTAELRAAGVLDRAAPLRLRTMPSLSYRLALVAAGEAAGAIGLRGPRDWDYAGAHALLRGSNDLLVDESGRAVSYAADGTSQVSGVFAGSADVVQHLSARSWSEDARPVVLPFARLARGRAHRDAARLRHAQGCLLGQLAGDALGSLVEFQRPEQITSRHPRGVTDLHDGGTWDTIAGQPTDDSELALALARSILAVGEYRPEAALEAYRRWEGSSPFDIGGTTARALRTGAPDGASQTNGSLMRVSPLGILGWNKKDVADLARADSGLTHPHAVCRDACAAFVAAIARGIAGGDARSAHEAALAEAREPAVAEALRQAASGPPASFIQRQGWVLTALRNAFHQLLHAPSFESALVETVGQGGDTDTNAAIAGALLGAVHGREAIPFRWRAAVMTCRPLLGRPDVRRPRPREYWPIDALELAECLLET